MARFEDLSGEILMAIFEYMHVQDVWTIFFNMNYRLSSLVFDSRLRLTADVSNIEKNDFNQFCSSLINTNFSNIYTLVLSNNFNRYPQIKNFLSQTTLQNFQSLHALTVIDINYMELVEISSQIKNMPSLNYLHVNTHEIFRQNELSQVCPMLLDKSNIRVLNISLHEVKLHVVLSFFIRRQNLSRTQLDRSINLDLVDKFPFTAMLIVRKKTPMSHCSL